MSVATSRRRTEQRLKPWQPRRRARGAFRACAAAAACSAAALALPAPAWAHAQLEGTSPVPGATVATQPAEVIFSFDEPVGGTAGAVRVYDSQGAEVDDGKVGHPGGVSRRMGVGLKARLPDGTYTATYRVVSADTHIVYGGLVFNLGHASAASKVTVAGLIGKGESGEVTKVGFGVVRALSYLTLALFAGGLAFLLLVWPAALEAIGDTEERRAAAAALRARALRLVWLTVVLGALVSVLGVLLQGASASGESLWGSLNEPIVQSTLETRFGWVWGVRAVVWLALGFVVAATSPFGRAAETFGNRGSADSSAPATAGRLAMAAGALYLVMTPALAGHASIESPRGVFFPSDVIHVAAGSIWVGGVCFLLLALPAATRSLAPERRGAVLHGALSRFSPLALSAVAAIALTGVVQAFIDVRSLNALFDTTYGLLVLAKTACLLALIGLGWTQRSRVLPALQRVAAAATAPGDAGRLARRALRGELAVMVAVLGLTAALISYAPPVDLAGGPFAIDTRIGAALLEMTVEPASVGPNTIHIYLIDAKTGAQFTATKELTATARLPARHIGPLRLHPTLAGPGHYVFNSAVLSPGGTWQIEIHDRTSEFDEATKVVEVPIR